MAFQIKQLFFEQEPDGFTILVRDGAAENSPVLDSISVTGDKFREFLEAMGLGVIVEIEDDFEDDDVEDDVEDEISDEDEEVEDEPDDDEDE